MDVTTPDDKIRSNKSAGQLAANQSDAPLIQEKAPDVFSESSRQEPDLEVFELEACLDEALEDWQLSAPDRQVARDAEEVISGFVIGEANILQALVQSMLRRVAASCKTTSLRFYMRRDQLFSSDTHVAFSMVVEGRRRVNGATASPEEETPPSGLEMVGQDAELSQSRQLIQRLGGELRLENLKSGGLRMMARLRFALGTAPLSANDSLLLGVRVLVVDDDALSRVLTSSMLRTLKAQVVTARHGEEALKLAEHQEFDIIFLDIEMPIMDGVSTCQAFRQVSNYEHVPILALTSHEHEDLHSFYVEQGMQGVMVKPLNKQTICDAVERFLLGRPHLKCGRKDHSRWPVEDGSRLAAAEIGGTDQVDPEATADESGLWIDAGQLRDAFDDARELLELCITVFAKRYPTLLDDIEAALKRGDAPHTSQAAHELKGMLANLWAPRLTGWVASIEDCARVGRLKGCAERVLQLRQSIPYCVRELQETVKTWPEHSSVLS